jgi:hypothetical protein
LILQKMDCFTLRLLLFSASHFLPLCSPPSAPELFR